MDFAYSQEQQKLLADLDQWLDACDFGRDYFTQCYDERRYPIEFFKAYFESPFGKMGLPESIGGVPATVQDQALIAMRMGERGFPTNVAKTMGIINVAKNGTPEQIEECLRATETGNVPYALAFTEPQAGSDVAGYEATASDDGDNVVINGAKTMIMHASYAPYMLVIVREKSLADEKPYRAMSIYIVPRETPGVTIEPLMKIGCKMFTESAVHFDNVVVPASNRLGEKGAGFGLMMANMEVERTLVACDAYGQAYQAYEAACRYANERIQFGSPIGTFQLIQEKIAEMYLGIELMRLHILQTAWKKDNGVSVRIDSAATKLYAAREAFEIADSAMQTFGGYGYYEDNRASRLWRDTRQARLAGGTDEIMLRSVGKDVLREFKD